MWTALALANILSQPRAKYVNWGWCLGRVFLELLVKHSFIGPSEVRAPAVGVAHAGGERSVHY